jgi:hydrophobe/amphiphile efflux-3 (HAE3) family protein
LPFAVVLLSILFSMGMMPLLGWQMSIITLLLPIMLIAIANDYGIHLMARYQEINIPGNGETMGKISRRLFISLRAPILMAGLTTLAGFLSLGSHKMIPARQLGFMAAIGIVFAVILSLFFIPAVLSLLGKSKPVMKEGGKSGHLLDRLLHYFSRIIIARPGRILFISFLLTIVSGIGIIWLKVDTNLENFFPKNHEVRTSAKLIDRVFGGSQNISILVEGDILDPEILRRIDHYENELKSHPAVGNVTSVTTVIREISKAMNDPGDKWYDTIPGTRNAVAQYLELYSMSGDMSDLEKLVDFNYENAQILVRINNGSNASLKSVLTKIKEMTAKDKNVTRIGGYGLVAAELGELVVRGQISSLALALLLIMIIVAIFFRSPEAGFIAAIPIGLSMIILFGWMGYLGVRLDVATALLSSIMRGVGVDYTIHFLWRYREEKQLGLKSTDALKRTMVTTGRGITFNALSVIIGFAALPFSVFPPLRFFGFLVMVSIFACLIGALVIIPSAVLIFRPRFLEPGKPDKREYMSIRFRFITKMFRLALTKER